MNKTLRILSILILLIVIIYNSRYKIGAFYFNKISHNDLIHIMSYDQDSIKGYNDIIKLN